MERFARTELLLGPEALQRLRRASVLVVGLGAVGGFCLEALVRAGIGRFRLVDMDRLRPSNMNRQILATSATMGMLKTDAARERVHAIAPDTVVETLPLFAAEETFGAILAPGIDIAVDAIDGLTPKVSFLATAWRQGIPTFSSMGAATRMDPAQVRTGDIFDTRHCPLAARIRKRLKDMKIGRGIQCVYSEEIQDAFALSTEAPAEPEDFVRGRPRRQLGSLPTLTGIFGLALAHLVIRQVTKK